MNSVVVAPPQIAGAEFVGSDTCAGCHPDTAKNFKYAAHARMEVKGQNAQGIGCEGCHGAGSKHVEAGGSKGTIIDPDKSPDVCYQCHMDKRGEFALPYHHPVPEGRMTCTDCHNPHEGEAMNGGGTQIASMKDVCGKCHTAQMGPFIWEHEALNDGCGDCHRPHGSPNQKLLTERNATLCLKCHFQEQAANGVILIGGRDHGTANGFLTRGTCWSAGCHETVHGSNVSSSQRF